MGFMIVLLAEEMYAVGIHYRVVPGILLFSVKIYASVIIIKA